MERMTNMKKKIVLSTLLAFVMAMSLVGCGKNEVSYQAKAGAAEIGKASSIVKNETSTTELASTEVEETEEIFEDVVEVVANNDNTHLTKTTFANGDYEELLDMCTFEDGICIICGGKYTEPVATSTPEPFEETKEETKVPEKETKTPEPTTPPATEKPVEEKPSTPTPEPTPEPTTPPSVPEEPVVTPTPETPVEDEGEWMIIVDEWVCNDSSHTHTVVYQNTKTFEQKEETTSESHNLVMGDWYDSHNLDGTITKLVRAEKSA